MNRKQRLFASCALGAALGLAAPALAQEAAPEDSGTIGEVVVTANKRAENLQNVAATVTAVNEVTLQRQGVKDITDITRVAPEVKVATGQFTNVTIRGIRTGAFGPSTDSPNAVHVDGVYISRFTSLNGLFFDVQRVEVLAGPQGTLYGRNSAGGTMNIITNKPINSFGGQASIEYGNYDALTANAALNIPLTDTLAIRGAFFHNSHKGYADNGTDDADQNSGRFSLLWRPTLNDSLLFTADREKVGGKGAANAQIVEVLKQPTILTSPTGSVSLVAAGTPGGEIVPIIAGDDPRHLRQVYGDQDMNRIRTASGGLMGQYDHDFGWANLTFQAAYRNTWSHNRTGTTSGFIQDPRLVTAAVIRPAAPGFVDANSKWDSQELRLTSPSDQALTYVVGLYRFHEKSYDNHSGSYRVSYPNTSAATVGQVVVQYPLVVNSDIINALNVDDAYAAFGQATYSPPPLPNLHLTAGIRYNDEKKHGIGSAIQNGAVNPASVFDRTKRWTATTYKLNAAYDLTPRNMVYVDHSTGFKSGGFAYGSTPQYEPEKIKSYEIGTKNRFFDNRLQVNASLWHYDYTNIVTTVFEFFFDQTLGRPNSVINTANGRKAKVDGQTITIDAVVTPNDLINFSATHLNARFTDYDIIDRQAFSLANGLAPGATPAFFDYSGTPIGNVPDWSFNATYDHIFQVWGGELDAQAAIHYTGEQLWGNQASRANVNNYIVGDPFATGDVSLRYQPDSRRWSITAYVRNVTDKDVPLAEGYSSNANFFATSDPAVRYAYRTVTYGPPRTFGVILNASF